MDVFWSKGYESASLACLCKATGLHKGSLYQAFGDKKHLFLKALNQYSEIEFAEVSSVISETVSPITNIRTIIDTICDRFDANKGCLMINSMTGLTEDDQEVSDALKSYGEKRLNALKELIIAAQSAGEINSELSPHKLAQELILSLAGAAATIKAVMNRDDVRSSVHRLIDHWM
jgi:TetR/AcrR family transcriptional repressor of nem operon